MEMRVYIANLGKYNEGELVGAWFDAPIDFDEVREKVKLNDRYEEYAIHDYELPLTLNGEFYSIEEINKIYELVSEIKDTPIYEELEEILSNWFKNLEELIENKDNIIFHEDCKSMFDIAEKHVEELGILEGIRENFKGYFDYESLGRDMDLEGNYLITKAGIFEYIA